MKKDLCFTLLILIMMQLFACSKITRDDLMMPYAMVNLIDKKGYDFAGLQVNGKHDEYHFELYKHQGKVIILYEIRNKTDCQLLEKLYNEYDKNTKGVLIYGYMKERDIYSDLGSLPKWFKMWETNYPLLFFDDDARELWEFYDYPTILILDEDCFIRVAYNFDIEYDTLKKAVKYVIEKGYND